MNRLIPVIALAALLGLTLYFHERRHAREIQTLKAWWHVHDQEIDHVIRRLGEVDAPLAVRVKRIEDRQNEIARCDTNYNYSHMTFSNMNIYGYLDPKQLVHAVVQDSLRRAKEKP